MRRKMSEIPEMARGDGAFQIPADFTGKRGGCNDSDVEGLVREVRAARREGLADAEAWARAKEIAGWNVEDCALEAWRSEVLRRASLPTGGEPVLPPRVAEAPARLLPPELERLYRDRETVIAELERARGDRARFAAAVSESEAQLAEARTRAVLQRNDAASTERVEKARRLAREAVEAETDARLREEAAARLVAQLDGEIEQAEKKHGNARRASLGALLAERRDERDEQLLDALAERILAVQMIYGVRQLEVKGDELAAALGDRLHPDALAARVARVEARLLAEVDAESAGKGTTSATTQDAPSTAGRARRTRS